MLVRPCLISGADLWREIFNDTQDPVALLCNRLGCRMIDVSQQPLDKLMGELSGFFEPEQLTGWWLVNWPAGSNADQFDETAIYEQLTSENCEVYQSPTMIEEKGNYTLYQAFRSWKVITSTGASIGIWEFKTEKEARAFLASK